VLRAMTEQPKDPESEPGVPSDQPHPEIGDDPGRIRTERIIKKVPPASLPQGEAQER